MRQCVDKTVVSNDLYGVISPPKFKLLYATLLLSINARFFNPIFDFFNSTLCIDNSTSIFQNAIFNFYNSTFRIDNSTSKLCIMYSVIRVHRNPTFLFYFFTNQKSHFKFNFPSFTCDIRLFHCDVDARCV